MANKAMAIISLFLAILLINGCAGMTTGKNQPPVSAAFAATGTEGIVIKFVADQPPVKVYTQSPLTFLLEVRNRGTYSVPSYAIYLTGFDPNILVGLPVAQVMGQPLEGKSQYNPDGGYTMVTFETTNVNLPASMPNYKPTFMITACYPYQTIATPLVCIDPNPLDTTSDKACKVQKVYSTGSQGAPVAVQSIESEARPNGMFFRVHIANTMSGEQASGTVFDDAMMASCPAGLQYKDLNKVKFQASISGQPLACDPASGEIRLVNNQAVLFCKLQNMQPIPAYQTPIEVRLLYGYKNSASKIVEIENLNFAR
jgi:hypothetical protein